MKTRYLYALLASLILCCGCKQKKQFDRWEIDHTIVQGDSTIAVYKKDVLHPEFNNIGEDSVQVTVYNGFHHIVKRKTYHIKDLP